MIRLSLSLSLSLLYLSVLTQHASAQIVSNYTSVDPLAQERFGSAAGAAAIITGGNLDSIIVGVPKARGSLWPTSEAGEVEFIPVAGAGNQYKITAPSGYEQAGAHFGAAVAAGYIDGDGYADVLVGAPDYDVNGVTDQGRVFVFFGPWDEHQVPPYSGFVILDALASDQPGHARFGTSLAVGDLDANETFMDIVVGAPKANTTGVALLLEVGAVDVFLNINTSQPIWTRNQHVLQDPQYLGEYNHYGTSVAIGLFRNLGSTKDIAVGAPDSAAGGGNAGMAQVHFSHLVAGSPVWDNSPGNFQNVLGYNPTPLSALGTSVASDFYRGSVSYSNLAIGAPGRLDALENPSGPNGSVHVYQGSASGLVPFANPADGLLIAPTGPPNYDTPHNLFGYSVLWACTSVYCSNTPRDLFVGAPGATSGVIGGFEAGRVFRYQYQPGGSGPASWPVDSFMDPTPANGERFGWVLAASNRGGPTAYNDIVIGVPRSPISNPGVANGGEVYVWNY